MLEHGADIDGTSTRGWTPLMAAIFFGNREIVDFLLEHGGKAGIVGGEGATAHSIALWRGSTDLAAKLPTVTRKPTEADLVATVAIGNHAAIDQLLLSGIRPTAANADGTPALLVAAAVGDVGAVGRLPHAGAAPDLA